jgi:ferredoxin--NADP+ reductase
VLVRYRPRDDLWRLAFNIELRAMLEELRLIEGANSNPQHYVVEKAF